MSDNLVTLTQDEIDRFNLKDKQVGDAITATEYSALQKKAVAKENKEEAAAESAAEKKSSGKK